MTIYLLLLAIGILIIVHFFYKLYRLLFIGQIRYDMAEMN
jgi:hypothetical protein